MNTNIFISYRREDSEWVAVQLYNELVRHFSDKEIFIDIDSIAPGEDFEKYIQDYIINCRILLVLIGPRWLDFIEKRADKVDFVRIEIAAALKNNRRIIPILLGNTLMPPTEALPADIKGLGGRNAYTINPRNFNSDVDILIKKLKEGIGGEDSRPKKFKNLFTGNRVPEAIRRKPYKFRTAAFAVLLLLLLAAGYFLWQTTKNNVTSGLLKMTELTVDTKADSPVTVIDLTTGYTLFMHRNDKVRMPFSNYAPVTITLPGVGEFFYLLKPQQPLFNFKIENNKLYVNDELKAIYISKKETDLPLDPLQINSLETITFFKVDTVNSTLYTALSHMIRRNPKISIINISPKLSDTIADLMVRTEPEMLVCNTSFGRLRQMNLEHVTFAMIDGQDIAHPLFYENLVLPKLKTLITKNTETNKLLLRNSAESITCIVDTTLTDLTVLKNRDNIKRLQILDDDLNRYYLNFTDLSGFKNLKSFGYYNKNHVPNISPVTGMISLDLFNVNLSDIDQLAQNNPDLEQLSISFSDPLTDLNWAASFKKLRSLSVRNFGDETSVDIDHLNVSALNELDNLESFAVETHSNEPLDKTSAAYKKIAEACPRCSIHQWYLTPGLCLGSGWLILFYPLLFLFFFTRARSSKTVLIETHKDVLTN